MKNMEEGRRPAGILIRKKDVKPAMNDILSIYSFKERWRENNKNICENATKQEQRK